jgi:prevent-host-death family protein
MKTFNVHEAKTNLSRLLARVEKGEEIVIGKAGRPVALLVPFVRPRAARQPGSARGLVKIARNFDAPLPKRLQRDFEGD